MARIRRDVAKLGAGWNPTLEWYALAVEALLQRPITDPTSWTYLAAIHGMDPGGWVSNGVISPSAPLPSPSQRATMWDQCQHGGWFFLPWHRGYLAALEAVVAQTVADLGGPDDWALPYWNYLDASNPNRANMPAPFTAATMPNGRPNPLAAPPRVSTQLNLARISLAAMSETRFTSAPGTLGFGGGATGFLHFGGATGAVEQDPHNIVHVMIGGFMGDPDYAGLDPIFWLHHCNVDRLWAAWLTWAGNVQENGAAWTGGPFPRQFQMPDPAGNLAVFTPGDTLPGGALAPTYDDLTAGTGGPTLVAGVGGAAMPATLSSVPPPPSQLLGSNDGRVVVGASPAATRVALAPEAASPAALAPRRIFLNLENIKGTAPSGTLAISVGVPSAGTVPAVAPAPVKTVSLFGLAKATRSDGPHAGNGLGAVIDITDLARRLMERTGAGLEQLDVRVEQVDGAPASEITIEKVTVVSQPGG
ncbi:tyrosinase family protein [Mesorhizobium australicum]|uniref:Tyrosinase n=1 Tax=Mesorhizobium australicum TaxID=536018 RepID=A0A1X7PSQ5_9HYPH|nr:tyrosinase family protein [Mesorhizobium australicum]SMH55218.1 tyrosinase [Mesorhizobium australicum]